MFLDELTPFLQELARQPVAFLGGFVSGALRLNLDDDTVKSWLCKLNVEVSNDDDYVDGSTGNSHQQISID